MFNNVAIPHKHQESGVGDLYDDYHLKSWLLTSDHRRLAILYFGLILFFLLLAGLAASVLRLELLTPATDFVSNAVFTRFYTTHDLLLIFFVLVPLMPAVFGNFLVPLMIGAKRMALPRLNLLSWYLYLAAGSLFLLAVIQGGVDSGWTLNIYYGSGSAHLPFVLTCLSVILVGCSSILLAVNLITTIHAMRASEVTWSKLPLFVWSIYVASLLALIGTPILIAAIFLILVEGWLEVGMFAPQLGGDPILYQHLFWFYGNQMTFAIGLPAIGIILEIMATFARRQVFGHRVIPAAFIAIGYLGVVSWGVQIAPSNLSGSFAMLSSFLATLISVPITIIAVSLVMTFYQSQMKFDSPLWFAFGSLGLILVGVLSGLILSVLALNKHLHDTYFVTAHVYYAVSAVLMAGLAGLHFWWPKVTGRTYPQGLAKLAVCVIFVGTNLTFFIHFVLGYIGLPQYAQSYSETLQVWQVSSTLGATVMIIGYILVAGYLSWSLAFSESTTNPWQAKGLAWEGQLK